MQCGLVCCVLAILICKAEIGDFSGGTQVVVSEGMTEDVISEKTYNKIAQTFTKLTGAMWYLKQAGVHTKPVIGVLKFLPQVSAITKGAALAMLLFRIYSGTGETPMMKKIKTSFLDVNKRLDEVTSDLKNNRNLIRLAASRQAYINAENKILSAHKNVRKYYEEITNLKCKNKLECDAIRLLIPQKYLASFNVKKEVDLILKGATTNGVFGDSLLTLTKESSKCDIKKIEVTASIITGLATKGQIAAMLYESLTDSSFDIIPFEVDFAAKLLALEKKKDKLAKQCYDNIDRYLRSDVNYLSRKNYKQFDIKTANRLISEFLEQKYFWIPFYVMSLAGDKDCGKSKRRFWASNKLVYDMRYVSEDYKVLSYVFIGHSNSLGKWYHGPTDPTYLFNTWDSITDPTYAFNTWDSTTDPTYTFSNLFSTWGSSVKSLNSFLLHVDPCYKGIVRYKTETGNMQIRDVSRITAYNDGLVNAVGRTRFYYGWLSGYRKPLMRVIALDHDNTLRVCSLDCSSHGDCHFLPHTRKMYCVCTNAFYGTNCELSIETQKMSNDLNKLLKINIQRISTNSDLKAELKQLENNFRSNFQTSTEITSVFSKRIGQITTNMVDSISNSQQMQGLVIQYAGVIQDLQYYYHVMFENDTSDNSIKNDQFLREERMTFAQFLANPDKLEKNLQMVNYLFVGRRDTPLVNHKSLIFEEMENNKADICSDKYKLTLDHVYESLSAIQLQGFTAYIQAFHTLGIDSSTLVRDNEAKLIGQKKYLDATTCNIAIPHSKGLENCKGGYYVYSGMEIDVVCRDTFHLQGC